MSQCDRGSNPDQDAKAESFYEEAVLQMTRDNNLVPCMEGIERGMSREEGEIRGAPEEGQTQEDAGEDQAKAG